MVIFILLFSAISVGGRRYRCVHRREFLGTFGEQPTVLAWGLSILAVYCRGFEYRGIERRKMASERRRGDDVHSVAAARCSWRNGVAEIWGRDPLYVGEHDATME